MPGWSFIASADVDRLPTIRVPFRTSTNAPGEGYVPLSAGWLSVQPQLLNDRLRCLFSSHFLFLLLMFSAVERQPTILSLDTGLHASVTPCPSDRACGPS